MDYRFSRHAQDRIAERGIPRDWLDEVLETAGERVAGYPAREIRQGRFERNGKPVLLRVITEGDLVGTALLTSKIEKYGG